MPRAVCLMYHELEMPGRNPCDMFRGHLPYTVRESEFCSQMNLLKQHNWRGVSVGDALTLKNAALPRVVITLDDGCETDLLSAAPQLIRCGFNATFYIVVGWLGSPGYLTPSQLRELCNLGFEIGCHSMTHAFLTGLDDKALNVEIAQAKAKLEDISGVGVNHLSCPGGFWSRRVARCAQQAGYSSMATSKPWCKYGANKPILFA